MSGQQGYRWPARENPFEPEKSRCKRVNLPLQAEKARDLLRDLL